MGFAIVCDARHGHALGIEYLALVDRKQTKSTWWTSDDSTLILHYRSQDAAEYARKRLKHNHTQVVPYHSAVALIQEQAKRIMEEEVERDFHPFESGPFGHGQW